jgi:maleate isomerase
MAYTSWRGVVGLIKPTMRPGGLEELIRMLPDGVCTLPLFLDIRRGTKDEFKEVMVHYETAIAKLAEQKVDLIHPEGAPPFMVRGLKGERKLLDKWEKQYKTPLFTSGTNHIAALKALGIKKFVGATYFSGDINDSFAAYFREAGFTVLAMEGIDVPFDQVGSLSAHEVYAHIKKAFLKQPKAEAIYMLGTGWRVLEMIETLEQDLGVPVIHPVPARCWEIQARLHIRQPVAGYGSLIRDLPPLPG